MVLSGDSSWGDRHCNSSHRLSAVYLHHEKTAEKTGTSNLKAHRRAGKIGIITDWIGSGMLFLIQPVPCKNPASGLAVTA